MRAALQRRLRDSQLSIAYGEGAFTFPPFDDMRCDGPGCGKIGAMAVCIDWDRSSDGRPLYAAFCCIECEDAAGALDYLKSEKRR